MTALTPTRSASPADVVALQYGNRYRLVGVPLIILGAVVVVSIVITLALQRVGGQLHDAGYNSGIPFSLAGFMVALGVQNVTASFPFALTLGSTRRAFVTGTLLTSVLQALLVTAAAGALLGLETATSGWFIGARVLRVELLGDGDVLVLAAVLFLGMLTALTAGGVFGAAWTRFGALGPIVLGLVLALVNAVGLLLAAPSLVAVAAAFRPWWLAVAAGVVILLSSLGQYLLLRRASVR